MSSRTPDQPNPDDRDDNQSRLDREIDEILAKHKLPGQDAPPSEPGNVRQFNRQERLKTPPRPNVRQHQPTTPSSVPAMDTVLAMVQRAPLPAALLIALLAVLIQGVSGLLATVLAYVAIVVFFLPYIRLARRKSPTAAPQQKMWRGRMVDVSPPSREHARHPLDRLRRWLAARANRDE